MSNTAVPSIDNVWSGVDWISASLHRDEIDSQVWLYDALHALELIAERGNKYNRRALLGFDGWECGGCFVGSNEVRHYAQFAGKYANDAYRYLEHPKVHISRIDIQITVQYSAELLKEGKRCYASANVHNKELPDGRRRKISIIIGSDGGDTVYLGAPSSETRCRIYNKQRQSSSTDFERCWRYEVVYKNDYAMPVFRALLNPDIEAPSIIVQAVSAYLAKRGVRVRGLGNYGGEPIEPPKTPPTDVERKLKWVKEQVVPTIRTLAELGYAEELMEVIAEAIAAARTGMQ